MATPKISDPFDRHLQLRINEAMYRLFVRKSREAGFRTVSEWARRRLTDCDSAKVAA